MKTPRIANAISHIDEELISNAVKTQKTAKKAVWIKWSSFAACFTILLIVAAVAVPTLFGDGNTTLPIISGDNTTTNNDEITVPATNDNGTTTAPTVNQDTTHINNTEPTTFSGNDNTTLQAPNENTTTNNGEITVPATNDNGTTTAPTVNQDTTHINNTEPTTSGGNDNTTLQAPNENTTQPVTENAFSEAYFYNVSDGAFSSYISGKVISADKIGSKLEDVSVTAGWKNNKYEWLTNETLRAEVYLINGISKDVAVALKFIDKGDALTTTHYYVLLNPNADLTAVQDYVIAPIEPNNTGNEIVGEVVENELAGEYVVEYTSQASNE